MCAFMASLILHQRNNSKCKSLLCFANANENFEVSERGKGYNSKRCTISYPSVEYCTVISAMLSAVDVHLTVIYVENLGFDNTKLYSLYSF